MQRIQCDEHSESTRPAIWHGIGADAAVARSRNWWTTIVGIDHPVEDYTRVMVADALGMIAWDPVEQFYYVDEIDEARLDASMKRNRIR